MRVVLDTTVIVSGLNFPGNERLALELALRGRFELCLSPFILEEVFGVLGRRFDWTEERSSQALRALGDAASADYLATGGIGYPLGSIGARESSTPPGSC